MLELLMFAGMAVALVTSGALIGFMLGWRSGFDEAEAIVRQKDRYYGPG